MLKAISRFFEEHLLLPQDASHDVDEHALRLATTALLVEMSRADFEVKAAETNHLLALVRDHFDISEAETRELMALASNDADHATTYHDYTSLINQHYSQQQKIRVIELLWEIAYADGEIEKYEDYLVRKIADLIYVSHKDFIAAKLRVTGEQS